MKRVVSTFGTATTVATMGLALVLLLGAVTHHLNADTAPTAPPRGTTAPTQESAAVEVDWGSLREGAAVPASALPPTVPNPARALPLSEQAARIRGDRVVIPALNAAIPILPSGIRNGHAVIPAMDQVGWQTAAARPGSRHGVAVLNGHLTNGPKGADQGPLWGAEKMPRGSLIEVTWRGKAYAYRVTHVTKHARGDLPPGYMDPNGRSRLALITCAKPWVGRDDDGDGDVDSVWLSRNAIIWAERVPTG